MNDQQLILMSPVKRRYRQACGARDHTERDRHNETPVSNAKPPRNPIARASTAFGSEQAMVLWGPAAERCSPSGRQLHMTRAVSSEALMERCRPQ
jgi:hypothetical protein